VLAEAGHEHGLAEHTLRLPPRRPQICSIRAGGAAVHNLHIIARQPDDSDYRMAA
jgi:hypothetical protein